MFRKLLQRPRSETINITAPAVEIVPVPAAKPAAEEPRHPVIGLQRAPSTALGKVFPPQESSVFRHKPRTTLKVPALLTGYAGLAEHIQALSADIHPKRDTSAQWSERLKTLRALAKQVERGEFKVPGAPSDFTSEADQDALLALDRLITLNKGSGNEQKAHRVKTFLMAAKEDHAVASVAKHDTVRAHVVERIDRVADLFNQGIEEYNTRREGYNVSKREGLPAGSSVAMAGVYPEIAAIIDSARSDGHKWRALDKIHQQLNEQGLHLHGYSAFSIITPKNLDAELRMVLHQCGNPTLTTADRVALVASAIEQFRPAAEYASHGAERIATLTQASQERKARILAGTEPPAYDGVEALNRAYEAQQEYARQNPAPPPSRDERDNYYPGYGYYKPGPLSTDRINDTAKKATIGLGILGVLGLPAAYMMRPQTPASAPEPVKTAAELNAEMKAEADKKRDDWYAQAAIDDARLFGALSSSSTRTPFKEEPYRAPKSHYDVPPPLKFVDDRSPEQRAYDACISSDADISTCPKSPAIERMEREAQEKFSGGNAAKVSPDSQDTTPPPISAAPRPTPAMVSYANEAFPKLAAGTGRTTEPLQEPNVTVNFDLNR